ncbi:pseudouridine-metabolizing bifunctional protein C1861.05 [Drosophila grimshawi]|uniref:GH11233 n=1 Tax=Drosophila grimshawi TaxID=7222 RepID=B4JDR4_DROGR|nr:pseudouridine-metabolizing bifunctional protein C1861.05 [Drosophila grimshawi]EDW03434.1 GH11233 [Drosophila grimshawi]
MLMQKCSTNGIRGLFSRAFATKQHIVVHPEIRYALEHRQPVVALESTIITHGMPMPENVETALQVEQEVRQNGALPATIGIIDGCIKVGLTQEELLTLAQKPREEVIKCSRRDLPYVVATGQSGGTTVAATMIAAHRVGIPIFATGGVGGVHREGHITLDVSADLVELGRTPVAVVCSGVKSILDIPRTLEYLETQGVCVASYQSAGGIFPDFYTRDSGCKVPYNLSTAAQAAALLKSWRELQLESGVLIGVPIPLEYAAEKTAIDAAIREANAAAQAQGVSGKEVTPFLLAHIAQLTKGRSLQANIALIRNNAAVAAQIACELANKSVQKTSPSGGSSRKPLVIGASILDLSFTVKEQRDMQLDGATYSAVTKQAAGGVGRNIAEGIYKLYGAVNLISAVGSDQLGHMLRQLMPAALQRSLIVDETHATSLCSLVFDQSGDCKLILGDMEVHDSITPEVLATQSDLFSDAPLIVMDCNISEQAMACTLQLAQKFQVPVFFEPTDMYIAGKPFKLSPDLTQNIRLLKPNMHELKTIVETITGQHVAWQPNTKVARSQLLEQAKQLLQQIEKHFNCIIATLGDHGVLLSFRSDAECDASKLLSLTPSCEHITRFYAAPKVQNIVNVSGAGDSFCAGFITALLKDHSLDECVAAGFVSAERALLSESAVPATYFPDPQTFESNFKQTLKSLQCRSI